MTWDASIPLHDHLPTEYVVDGVAINLALLPQIEQAAIQEDKARWHLADQMLRTKSTIEIRRWLAQQNEVYAEDMNPANSSDRSISSTTSPSNLIPAA